MVAGQIGKQGQSRDLAGQGERLAKERFRAREDQEQAHRKRDPEIRRAGQEILARRQSTRLQVVHARSRSLSCLIRRSGKAVRIAAVPPGRSRETAIPRGNRELHFVPDPRFHGKCTQGSPGPVQAQVCSSYLGHVPQRLESRSVCAARALLPTRAGRKHVGQGNRSGSSMRLGPVRLLHAQQVAADAARDLRGGRLHRIPRKVSVPCGRLNLRVTEKLADHREALAERKSP